MRRRYRGEYHASSRGLGQIPQGPVPVQPPAPKIIAEDFYIYAILFEDLAAGGTDTGFIQIEADSDFLIQKLTYFSDIDGSAQQFQTMDIPLVTIVVVDTGSGRQIMNQAIPIPSLFGDGRLPYILPTPKLFTKNTRINVTVTNFSSATEYDNIYINFEGKKIFTSG